MKIKENKKANVLSDGVIVSRFQEQQAPQFGMMLVAQILDKDDTMANPKGNFDEDVNF